MCITRRHILGLAGASLFSRAFGAALTRSAGFDVDRLLGGFSSNHGNASFRPQFRKYTANATVTFFSIPLVSKSSVGSGYAAVEEADTADGHALSIQFGAGSYPECARGLNRLGFIHEAIIEDRPGKPSECAWLAFMTTSKESSLDQAKKALEASGAIVPYIASQGYGHSGRFASRVDRLEFPSSYTWRDIRQLVEKARGAVSAGVTGEPQGVPDQAAATFLYAVRRAMIDPGPRTTSTLVFNGKQFQLDGRKEKDAAATEHFSERKLVPPSGCVTRMDSLLTEKRSGVKTPFRIWYNAAEQMPPLRFEYQARSFLRLTFEVGENSDLPPILFALKAPRETP